MEGKTNFSVNWAETRDTEKENISKNSMVTGGLNYCNLSLKMHDKKNYPIVRQFANDVIF